jgi:hypothetical protein
MRESQLSLNHRIEKFIAEKDFKKQAYSKEDIEFIQGYEGSGGQQSKGATGEGILYEFFTPDYVCELMWWLADKYEYDKGTVLEPSIATGRLIKEAPNYSRCVGFEINPVSARIAEISFPGVKVHRGYFETAFLQAPRFTQRIKGKETWIEEYPFSLVIGNPPYGKNKNRYSSYFPSPSFPQVEIFFMYYGLKLLKKGGLLIYLTSSNFMRNGETFDKSKQELEKLAEFVDAFRLPPVFKASKVPTDIIVFKRK